MYVQVSTRPTLTHTQSTRHARPRGIHVYHGCARYSTFRVDERERRTERISLQPLLQCVRVCVMNSALSDRQRDELYVRSMILTKIQT